MIKFTRIFFLSCLTLIGGLYSQVLPVNTNPVPGTCGGNCASSRNGNGSLGQIYNNSMCGLNYVQASLKIGQRFSPAGAAQPVPFNISLPPCVSAANGSIDRAYLWCSTSGNGVAITVNVQNPQGTTQSFPMSIVGSDADKCWGYAGTYTYRADVTSIITTGGNYTISGFPTGSPNDVDGATLMVIYRDPAAAYQGNLVIHDGTVMIGGGTTTQTVTGMNTCAAGVNARAFCAVADIQMSGQTLSMNGTNAPFTWDWYNYVEVPTTVTAGQTNANYTISSSGDCYNFMLIGMYYQTSGCATCPAANPLVLNMTSTPTNCSACNGTATVTPTGITGPFTYSWAPSGGNGATATGLCAGTYTVTVTANGGCISNTATVTISNNGGGGIQINGNITPVQCNGGNTGAITTGVTGNTGTTTYSWSPGGSTSNNVSNLTAGTYILTVSDSVGCVGIDTFTVSQPTAVAVTTNPSNISCNGGSNGSILSTPSGGTPGYTYSWAPSGGSNQNATNLSQGTYTVTVSDSHGCTATSSASITQPPLLTATTVSTPVSCNGGNDGSSTVTPSGGTPGYTYSWMPSGGANAVATGLTAGMYIVTVTDAAGCTVTSSSTITQPPPIALSLVSQTTPTFLGGSDGTATVAASGGTNPYTYIWAPTGATGATATGLSAMTYMVTATDATGCSQVISVTIQQANPISLYIPNTFTPNNDGINEIFIALGSGIKSFEMRIFDRWGMEIFYSNDIVKGWNGSLNSGILCLQDVYVYKIYATDLNGDAHEFMGQVNLIR